MMKKTKGKRYLVLSFLIPFLVMVILCILKQIYPFGPKCFLRTDLYNQYVPFYSELQQKCKAGESLDFSWQLGLGSNFMGVYAYYIASPTAFLSFLIPRRYLIELMTFLILCKIGFSGFSFCAYLKGHYGEARLSMVWFSVFYALSGFMAAYNWNIMWLDSVAIAPLIVLGLEKLILEKKWMLYTLTLGASIWINYYISIFTCIFLVLYFFVFIISEKRSLPDAVDAFKRFAFFSVLAAGLTCVILIPGTLAIFSTGFASSSFPKTFTLYFSPLDVIARHSMNVLTEIKTDHWPNIYCGVGILFLLPLYFSCKDISLRKKITHGILAVFFIASFSINVLNFIWHGLNYPDSLPARQSFLYIFLILIMCYEAVYHMEEAHLIRLAVSFGISVLLTVLFLFFVKDQEDYTDNKAFLVTILFLVVYAILVTLWKLGRSDLMKKLALYALTAVVIAEAGVNMYCTSLSVVTRSKYMNKYQNYLNIDRELARRDSGFYRTETNNRMTKNDGALAGFETASMFSSTVQKGVESFYQQLGFDYSKVYYHFEGSTPLTSALLGVKYFTSDKGWWEDPFRTILTTVDKAQVYALDPRTSVGYVLPEEMLYKWKFEEGNALEAQNRFAEILGAEEKLFTAVNSETNGNETKIATPVSGIYYVFISGGSKTKGDTIEVSVLTATNEEKRTKEYINARKGHLLCLGECGPDDTVTLTTKTGSMDQVKVHAYLCETEAMKNALDLLTDESFTVTKTTDRGLKGEVTAKEDGILLFSVPYDKGFEVRVDGVITEYSAFCDAFLAIPVSEGSHIVSLEFTPRGKKIGLVISLTSLVIFIILAIRSRQKN